MINWELIYIALLTCQRHLETDWTNTNSMIYGKDTLEQIKKQKELIYRIDWAQGDKVEIIKQD